MSTVERDHVVAPAVVTERDVLHRAADLLEEFGWTQSEYAVAEDGLTVEPGDVNARAFCAVGAVYRAGIDLATDIHDSIGSLYTGGDFSMQWNDAPGRTKAEVVAKLREAAEASAA